jgi:hypothetical protein
MKCPVCKQQVTPAKIPDPQFRPMRMTVVGLHMGRNKSPCSGSGQQPK